MYTGCLILAQITSYDWHGSQAAADDIKAIDNTIKMTPQNNNDKKRSNTAEDDDTHPNNDRDEPTIIPDDKDDETPHSDAGRNNQTNALG